jgi:hypothetical protein
MGSEIIEYEVSYELYALYSGTANHEEEYTTLVDKYGDSNKVLLRLKAIIIPEIIDNALRFDLLIARLLKLKALS